MYATLMMAPGPVNWRNLRRVERRFWRLWRGVEQEEGGVWLVLVWFVIGVGTGVSEMRGGARCLGSEMCFSRGEGEGEGLISMVR